MRLGSLTAGGGLILGVRDDRHIAEHTMLLRGTHRLSDVQLSEIRTVLDEGAAPHGDVWHHERGWAR